MDAEALQSEIRELVGEFDLEWSEFALFLKLKMVEAAKNGGVTTYTINGRSVTKDLRWWQDAYKFAKDQANIENSGGIDSVTISFRKPVGSPYDRRK